MDFHKAGILLEKINALYKNMSVDTEGVSEFEKDLMRAYLAQFFDHFSPNEEMEEVSPPPVELPKKKKKKKKKVEVLKAEEEEEEDFPSAAPVIEEEKEEEVEVEPPAESSVFEETDEGPVEKKGGGIDTLFEHHQATELSEKLSELPIQDLSKAMGLNEKIFTINELFDGDQEAFKDSIQVLNGFHSFEEAKNYLVTEIAVRYNWALKEKKSKAKNFIKLVRRRYNA